MKINSKNIQASIKISETIIKIGLIASGIQLVYAFAYDDFLSWLSASFKATFIEVSVWILTQALVSSVILPRRSKIFVWGLLVLIFIISTRANLQYELKQIAKHQSLLFTVYEYKLSDYIDAWLKSAILPALILGLIYARVLIAHALQQYEIAQRRMERARERSRRYRERQRQLENEFKKR